MSSEDSSREASSFTRAPPRSLAPRRVGLVNVRGLWTLYHKEIMRFANIYTQTVMAPVVATLLFLAIFTLALSHRDIGDGLPYDEFLAPGLVAMALIQNAFANTSSSILLAKIQGNIVDVLMPPLSSWELVAGFAAAGVTRGLLVGLCVTVAMTFFVPLPFAEPAVILFSAINASLTLAMLGLLAGIWSEKFEHISAFTNFVIIPLSFLSGTFYSLERLPPVWQSVAAFNPFFYMIDGVRYGFLGRADGDLLVGAVYLLALNLALVILAHRLVLRGWHLKA